ncbi:MAG: iron transporter, partial [Adhaeribacter sp.]|nr:iron transporter [Adhaeribacter sp.]
MPFFIDQLSDNIFLPQPPSRIISLVPSQTELLFHLGLGEKIVGVTKYCVHPKQAVKTKTKIGGTKNFDLELIQALQPDLIIGNKEENYLVGIMQLKEKYPVWMSDIFNLPDALAMIKGIGQITQTQVMANNLGQAITQEFAQLSAYGTIPAAYFIWRKPYMGVGNNTFIHEMLKVAGFQNVFGQVSRYPAVTSAD